MNRFLATATATLLFTLPSLGLASTWNIDPEHSHVGFKVRHLMVSNVKGSFGKVQGVVHVDDKDFTRSKVTATIDTASIDTGVKKRDDHLRSPDFLDTAKYPAMTFVSKKIETNGTGKFRIIGDLTLRGVTKAVVLDVEGPTAEGKDFKGNTVRGASATTKIDRKEFGIVWNKAIEAGGVAVGNDVDVSIEVELVKVAD